MVFAPVLSGCELLGIVDPTTQSLPPPKVRRVDPPVRSADEQPRQNEVDAYLFNEYQERGWQIIETNQTYGGDIIDCLNPVSVVGPDPQPEPPPLPAIDALPIPEGMQLQVTELDTFPELRCPAGTTPMTRPTFEAYIRGETDATSVDDFITNHQAMAMPDGADRLYAGLPVFAPNQGASAWVNQYGGDIEPRTFSLIELSVLCRGADPENTMEVVGIVATRDRANFGDAVVRLQVEFFTKGPNLRGANKGG